MSSLTGARNSQRHLK